VGERRRGYNNKIPYTLWPLSLSSLFARNMSFSSAPPALLSLHIAGGVLVRGFECLRALN